MMKISLKKIKRFTGFLLAGLVLTAFLLTDSAEAQITDSFILNQRSLVNSSSVDTFVTSGTKLVTWNKIDSEADYKEFLALSQKSGGVPLMITFTDNGSQYVLNLNSTSGTNTSYSIPVTIKWSFEGSTSDSYSRESTLNTLLGQHISQVSNYVDGLTLIKTDADHIVSYGEVGSCIAVADTSTKDTEDFLIRGTSFTSSGAESAAYLKCREGYPLWHWEDISLAPDDYYPVWKNTPILSLENEKVSSYTGHETVSADSGYGTVTLNKSSSWKLGFWANSYGSSTKNYNSCFIYQETTLPEKAVHKSNGSFYSFLDAGMFNDRYPYQHAYAVLCAQHHSDVQLVAAAEVVSKEAIGYFTGTSCLYDYNSSTKKNRIVSNLHGSEENAYDYSSNGRSVKDYSDNLYPTADFEVYYAVEGISKSAIYGDEAYSANANVIASDDNVAKVYYKTGNTSVETPRGNTEAALQNSIYTVSKNQVVVIPEGSTLTVEEGATLVVSSGGVLVLNGGIINRGLILVQSGGMILRYNNSAKLSSNVTGGTATYVYNGIVKRDGQMLPTYRSVYGFSDISGSGTKWYACSAIVCDGGDMIVRKNGRVRVSSLAVGTTTAQTATGSISWQNSRYVIMTIKKPSDSSNGSTVLNYGYIQAYSCISTSQANFVVNGGRLALGDEYKTDLLLTTSFAKLLNLTPQFAGLNADLNVTTINNGSVKRYWYSL